MKFEAFIYGTASYQLDTLIYVVYPKSKLTRHYTFYYNSFSDKITVSTMLNESLAIEIDNIFINKCYAIDVIESLMSALNQLCA